MLNLSLERIIDQATRSALEEVQGAFNAEDLLQGGLRLVTITSDGAVTNGVLFHNLGFVPQDVIITKQVGGSVIWDWDSATKDKINYTTSGAVDIRALIGRI